MQLHLKMHNQFKRVHMKQYFTMSQAARICAVNRTTMLRWVKSGKIEAYSTAGGHKRILPEVLKKWLDDNQMPFDINKFQNKKTRILIVDDDRSIRMYLTKILKGVLIETETAADGFIAGKKIAQFRPDLVILDLSMPYMDGFEVCKTLKMDHDTSGIKIIVLTGHATEENKKKAMLAGADAFLKKPSSKEEILSCIENTLMK